MREWTCGVERLKRWPHSTMWVVRDEAGEFVRKHANRELAIAISLDMARRAGLVVRVAITPARTDVEDWEWARDRPLEVVGSVC